MKYSVTSINGFGVKTQYKGKIDIKYQIKKIRIKEIPEHIMERNPRIKRLTTKVLELGV